MALNDSLFNQTFNQLQSHGFEGNLQLYASPIDFTFDVPPVGELSAAANQIISIMPQWSEVGTYNPQAATMFSAYQQVLTHVTWKVSPEQQGDLKKLKQEVTNAQNAVTEAWQDANQAYVNARDQGGEFFAAQYANVTAWMAEGAPGAAWKQQIDEAARTQTGAEQSYQSLVRAYQPKTLQESQKAAELPSGNPVNDSAPRGWAKVKDGTGRLQWTPSYTVGTTGQDWRAKLTSGSAGAFSLTMKAAEANSSLKKSWAGGKASYGNPFWGVNAGGSWSNMDLSQNDKSVSTTVKVQSSTVVPVTPGAWYNGGFMSNLAKAAQGTDGQGWTIADPWIAQGGKGSSSLFGQYGLLSTSVAQLVVVYKPSFSISMSESTFRKHSDAFSASAGVRIGPFTFGGSGGHSNEWSRSTNGSTEFSGQSTSDNPLIIGMMVAFPGVGTLS